MQPTREATSAQQQQHPPDAQAEELQGQKLLDEGATPDSTQQASDALTDEPPACSGRSNDGALAACGSTDRATTEVQQLREAVLDRVSDGCCYDWLGASSEGEGRRNPV